MNWLSEWLFREPIGKKIKKIYNPKTLKQIARKINKLYDKQLNKEYFKKWLIRIFFRIQ